MFPILPILCSLLIKKIKEREKVEKRFVSIRAFDNVFGTGPTVETNQKLQGLGLRSDVADRCSSSLC